MNKNENKTFMYDISICIISHDNNDDLLNCLDSIYEQEKEKINFQIVIIDNVCYESVESFLIQHKREYKNLRIIRNKNRHNYAYNNNIAINQSSAKYILILNPDIIFIEPTFEILFKYMETNSKVGIVSSKLVYPNGEFQFNVRRFPNIRYVINSRMYSLGLIPFNKILKDYYMANDFTNEVKEVDYVIGAFMFIRSSVLNKVGLFDERFKYYGEDTDLCYRIKKSGWNIHFIQN